MPAKALAAWGGACAIHVTIMDTALHSISDDWKAGR